MLPHKQTSRHERQGNALASMIEPLLASSAKSLSRPPDTLGVPVIQFAGNHCGYQQPDTAPETKQNAQKCVFHSLAFKRYPYISLLLNVSVVARVLTQTPVYRLPCTAQAGGLKRHINHKEVDCVPPADAHHGQLKVPNPPYEALTCPLTVGPPNYNRETFVTLPTTYSAQRNYITVYWFCIY
eukprot:4612398-Amphidinium_carterae.1